MTLTTFGKNRITLVEGARSRARYTAAFRAAFVGLGARGIGIATSLISIPFVNRYLGDERFGLYLTLLSLTAFLSFTDFGVGNGLKSRIAQAIGRDDAHETKALVSNAFLFLGLVALAGIAAATLLQMAVPWATVFNVSDVQAVAEAGPAVFWLMVCYALSLPLNVVQHTQQALQKGHLASTWEALGSLTTLVALFGTIAMEATLPVLILAFMGAPLLTKALNTLWYFGTRERQIAPSLGLVEQRIIHSLVGTGGLFVVLQLVGAGAFMSDAIVIAQVIGPASVQDFALPEKLFNLISMVVSVLLLPLWPAYGEAFARRDTAWVMRTLRLTVILGGGAGLFGGTLLAVLSPWLLTLWVGDAVEASATLLVGLAVWKTLESIGVALAMYLNGVLEIRIQVLLAILLLMTAIPTKILFASLFGVAGMPWATIACYLVTTLIPLSIWIFHRSKRIGTRSQNIG